MLYIPYLILMIVSEVLILTMFAVIYNNKQKNLQLRKIFLSFVGCLFIWTFSLIMQILFQNANITLTFFEGLASFGACFLPVFILLFGIIFGKTKIKVKWYFAFLFIIPILSTILMFTNDAHHLMYEKYSVYLTETVFGKYFIFHSLYSYSCIFIGLAFLLFFSIKNSGLFSKQSLLIILGTLIPVIINMLGTLGIANLTVYITPISFTFGILCFSLAIFKFDFLKIAPIALQKIVDCMSDSYIVINENNTITDFNDTFLKTFGLTALNVRNKNIHQLLENTSHSDKFIAALEQVKTSSETITFEKYFENFNKYFNIEINTITNNHVFLGTLILFKDITQHVLDLKTIKSNQDLLMEKERLASLGQLIGGIAHNLKTPIMSIAGAAEGLSDLVKEYDASIEDAEVTAKDHHDIAKDMKEWVEKVKTHTSYMSDVITAVKGQAVALAENQANSFTLDELVKRVNILMKHELKNALIELNIHMDTDSTLSLNGNINSLVQVINNMISNAIQAYNGEPNQMIDMYFHVENNMLTIAIEDHGMGMSEEVQHKLFKEMITTKGKNGTGLGLFMSYSNIRGHFNGNITFESEKGKGTVFNIILPL